MDFTAFTDYIQGQNFMLTDQIGIETSIGMFDTYDAATLGAFNFPKYNTALSLQACCTTIPKSGAFIQVPATAVCISGGNAECKGNVEKHIPSSGWSAPDADQFDALFNRIIGQDYQMWVRRLETLFYKGDTTSTDANLKMTNGVIKLFPSGNITAEDTDIYNAIQQVYYSLPPEADAQGSEVVVLVGAEIFKRLRAIFSFLPGSLHSGNTNTASPQTQRVTLTGLGIDVVRVPGLDGLYPATGGNYYIIATPLNNIVWLRNRGDDYQRIRAEYRTSDLNLQWWFQTVFGVFIKNTAYMAIRTVSTTILGKKIGFPVSDISATTAVAPAPAPAPTEPAAA
ncbi:MAG: hypothetical protein MdMp024_0019 [Bacteroidales bacterium]